ncbi:MAG: histidine--tRNA ligase [Firmicutes bacterium]|nr:histidine--tRNA ligase [Bacillota bacterium]
MALLTKAPRGTQDVTPKESGKWQTVERVARETAAHYGFHEIRTPVFEHTELFLRSVGDTTDVVQKEMYTFNDKGGRSITLRPEGTAGAARAMVEHALYNDGLPVKVWYQTSCYRYEKPQAGRLREFHQFGVECFGASEPAADAEIICLANSIFDSLGVTGLALQINSIGCPACRAEYHKALREYFAAHTEELCETCRERLERNPMRILDCKSPVCSEIAAGAPKMIDYLCGDCRAHFDAVQDYLTAAGIPFTVNPTIVRGLDYYTRTVFEFVSTQIGAQGTVCGGGRYDGLIDELGGAHTPSLGFGLGMERLLLLLEAQQVELPEEEPCDLYLAALGKNAQREVFALMQKVRAEGFAAECDLNGRSLKAQMKYADKIGAKFTMVIGDSELEAGAARLKNMATGEQREVRFSELLSSLYDARFAGVLDDIADLGGMGDEADALLKKMRSEE